MRILKSPSGLCLLCDYLEVNSIIGGFSIFLFFFTVGFFKLKYAQTLICCETAGSDCRSGVEPESAFLKAARRHQCYLSLDHSLVAGNYTWPKKCLCSFGKCVEYRWH